MEYLFIYLLQVVDTIKLLGEACLFMAVIALIVILILGCLTGFQYENFKADAYSDISEEAAKAASKLFKKVLITCIITGLLISFIPGKQTMLMMGGLYLGKRAANTLITDEKIKKIDTIINLELDKRIKELQIDTGSRQ